MKMNWKKLIKKLYKALTIVHVEFEMMEVMDKDQLVLYWVLGQCLQKVENVSLILIN